MKKITIREVNNGYVVMEEYRMMTNEPIECNEYIYTKLDKVLENIKFSLTHPLREGGNE